MRLMPLEIEVETKARRLMAELRALAELTQGLSADEKARLSERLQPDVDAMEEAMRVLFPGGL